MAQVESLGAALIPAPLGRDVIGDTTQISSKISIKMEGYIGLLSIKSPVIFSLLFDICPANILSNVVLPDPEGPIIACNLPRNIHPLTSFNIILCDEG
jgi:hypothetical protein